jgi:hypothetical protein
MFHLFDTYSAGISLLCSALFEAIAVSWFYGKLRGGKVTPGGQVTEGGKVTPGGQVTEGGKITTGAASNIQGKTSY